MLVGIDNDGTILMVSCPLAYEEDEKERLRVQFSAYKAPFLLLRGCGVLVKAAVESGRCYMWALLVVFVGIPCPGGALNIRGYPQCLG